MIGNQYQYLMTMESRDVGAIGRLTLRFLLVGGSSLIVDYTLLTQTEGLIDDTDQMCGYLARAGLITVAHALMTPSA